MHPPGETLHLTSLGGTALPGAGAGPVLSTLVGGLRLPYLLVTGIGWQDWLHNAPVQVGRQQQPAGGWRVGGGPWRGGRAGGLQCREGTSHACHRPAC